MTGGKSPRRKGDTFERRVKKALQEEGYHVTRQGGSKFPDLIAVKDINTGIISNLQVLDVVDIIRTHVLFIECKMRGYVTQDERRALHDLKRYGTPLIASRQIDEQDTRKTKIIFKNLDKEIVKLIGTKKKK